MSTDDYDKLINLAKEGLSARSTIANLNSQIHELNRRVWALKDEFNKLYERTKDFFAAVRLAPERVKELFTDIFNKQKEAVAQKQNKQKQSRWNITRGGRDAR